PTSMLPPWWLTPTANGQQCANWLALNGDDPTISAETKQIFIESLEREVAEREEAIRTYQARQAILSARPRQDDPSAAPTKTSSSSAIETAVTHVATTTPADPESRNGPGAPTALSEEQYERARDIGDIIVSYDSAVLQKALFAEIRKQLGVSESEVSDTALR